MQLLNQRALYFCGASKFEDPFEGQYAWGSNGNQEFVKTQKKMHIGQGEPLDFDMFMAMNIRTLNEISAHTYINCWHHSEHESEAMWKLYCKNPAEGVLIKTTIHKLKACLEVNNLSRLTLKPVKYVKNYWIKNYNPEQDVFFSKRVSFEHEKEFRAIFQNDPYGGIPASHGQLITVDLNKLLLDIRVSPLANQSFKELVITSIKNANINMQVNNSEIELQPQMSVEERLLAGDEKYKQYAIRLIRKYT